MGIPRALPRRKSWLLYFASSGILAALWQSAFLCCGLGFEPGIDVLKEAGGRALFGHYGAIRSLLDFPLLCVLSAWCLRNWIRSADTFARQLLSGCMYMLLPALLISLLWFLESMNWQISELFAFPLLPLYVMFWAPLRAIEFLALSNLIHAKMFLLVVVPVSIWLQVLALRTLVPGKKNRVLASERGLRSRPMAAWVKLKPWAFLCMFFVVGWIALDRLSSGRRHEDMLEVEAYLLENQETIHEFHKLFPAAEHGISYFTGEYGHPAWYSNHEWPDGWRISLHFPLEIDRRNNTARAKESLRLIVETPFGLGPDWELGPQYHVPEAVWRSFVDSKGDRTLLGIPIN